jgi:copper(I)-binding protein
MKGNKMGKNKMRGITALIISIGLIGLAACGDSQTTSDSTTTEVTAEAPITVSGQWARTTPSESKMGAAYMTLNSNADDELVGASVDKSVAMMTEVHEIVMVDGAMKMQQVSSIPVVAGTATELKPGGYHVMLMDLAKPLETGDSIQVTLTFAKAGDVVIDVPVLEDAP